MIGQSQVVDPVAEIDSCTILKFAVTSSSLRYRAPNRTLLFQ